MNNPHQIPQDTCELLIVQTATELGVEPHMVSEAIDLIEGHNPMDTIDAMAVLSTCDVGTLRAYLDGETLLDDRLDEWLAVG